MTKMKKVPIEDLNLRYTITQKNYAEKLKNMSIITKTTDKI